MTQVVGVYRELIYNSIKRDRTNWLRRIFTANLIHHYLRTYVNANHEPNPHPIRDAHEIDHH